MLPQAPLAASYACPWTVYGMSWCNRTDEKLLAVTSFTEAYENHLQILRVVDGTPDNPTSTSSDGTDMDVDETSTKNGNVSLESVAVADHPYPPTKVLWSPDGTTLKLATTADYLRLWHLQGDSIQVKATFSKYRAHENTSPITSADWNITDPNILATTSVDTSICIWDINNNKVPKKEIIAHDAEVFDMAFSTGTNVFASVGGDGTLRVFDLRNLDSCTVVYETADVRPLVRLAWNPLDSNYIATMLAEGPAALVMDLRLPSIPVMELPASPTDTSAAMNAFAWSPTSTHHIITVGEHDEAFVWDVSQPSQQRRPVLGYAGGSRSINQVKWSTSHPDFVGLGIDKSVHVVRV